MKRDGVEGDDGDVVRRAAALLHAGASPPPAGADDDVADLLLPYCLGDATDEMRARVVRAMARDPALLDEVLDIRRALRAAGMLPEADLDDGDADDEERADATKAFVVLPLEPRERVPARTRARPRRLGWYVAAGGIAAAATFAVLAVRQGDRTPPPVDDSPAVVHGRDVPPAVRDTAVRVDTSGGRADDATVPPSAPIDSRSPAIPPTSRVTLAALAGRDSVELRVADAADPSRAGVDELTRLVAAALPPALAADTTLRVVITTDAPAATRGGDRTGARGADADRRVVRIVIRSTAGPCVGPDAATVTPGSDLAALLQRSADEYRRGAAPPD